MTPPVTDTCGQAAAKGVYLPPWVRQAIADLPTDFTGKIELNVFKGGVADMHVVRRVIGPKP